MQRVEHGGHWYDEIQQPMDKIMLARVGGFQERYVARNPPGYIGSSWTHDLTTHDYGRGWVKGDVWKPFGGGAISADHPALSTADYFDNSFVRYRRLHAGPQ